MGTQAGSAVGQLRPPLRRQWDEPRIAAALRAFAEAHGGLRPGELQRLARPLYEICRHRFGGVAQAGAAFGLPVASGRHAWTEAEVLAAIGLRRADGLGLRSAEVRRDAAALYGAACKRFGNWSAALAAAGAAPLPQRAPTEEDLVAAVAAHRARGGGPLPPGLARAIRARHGSVPRFYDLHGLSNRWTSARVIEELRACGRPPSAKEARRTRPGFYFAALRLFHGWSAAVAAAFPGEGEGVPPPHPAPPPASPPWAPGSGRWRVGQAALDAAWAYVQETPAGRRISARELAEAAGVTPPAARRMLLGMGAVGAVVVEGPRTAFRRAGG